ncbi:hypothetical protein B0J11DRAFT_430405 [Dendryphion nanum]|uniref:Uncharacterized protein n=1 Tax=Dendryphion nanum TaxID=256645 RepID=A0A9P9IR78_9PLEO|nr:hypothetical protein B0J11DRAFT_430405 [Dendryphion nanum]
MIKGYLLKLIALTCAVAHYLLYKNLDGTLPGNGYTQQSRISALSLLLVTTFKTTINASVGLCFSQYLWYILHGTVVPLKQIEQLFTARSNLALGDIRVIWRAPLLLAIAASLWSLGIAMIYPPGALTVGLKAYSSTKNFTISVMNPKFPEGWDPMRADEGEHMYSAAVTATFANVYSRAGHPLKNIAKSVFNVGQISGLPINTGENSSYTMSFRAPQFSCQNKTYNATILIGKEDIYHRFPRTRLTPTMFRSHYNSTSGYYFLQRQWMTEFSQMGNPAQNLSDPIEMMVKVMELNCKPHSALYDVKISYLSGVEKIDHTIGDFQSLSIPRVSWTYDLNDSQSWPNSKNESNILSYPPKLQEFIQTTMKNIHIFNQVVILDTIGGLITHQWKDTFTLDDWNKCNPERSTKFRCSRRVVEIESREFNANNSEPFSSVFQQNRFNRMNSSVAYIIEDPRELHITEDMLNAVLTNITLSALKLRTWLDYVPVTTTTNLPTYRFSHRKNIIVPYTVCLSVAAIFAIVEVWSMWQNGAPVADGGFMQVMMATRGDTEMERLVFEHTSQGAESIPKELRELKVRYGELIGEGLGASTGVMGFGTVSETTVAERRPFLRISGRFDRE